jgi:guanylate kinase
MGRLVLLSGPSCVGKGPLCAALDRLHPELAARLEDIILYNSRSPRPGERDGVDYHFRSRAEILALGKKGFSVFEVRGDTQAVDIAAVRERLGGDRTLFFEGNPFVAEALRRAFGSLKPLTVFLSPLSREEILELRAAGADPAAVVAELMCRKLLRRTLRQKGRVSSRDAEEVARRCRSAWRELGFAWRFRFILPNHDGEDSENWDAFPRPVGDARKVLAAFVEILRGRRSALAETWEKGLLASV